MKGIIDRIEGNIVVVEAQDKMYNVAISEIEETLAEGDVVEFEIENEKCVSIKKDESATIDRKKYIQDLTKDMWQ